MKKNFYIKTALVALLAATGLSSCLKDNKNYVDFAGATPLIELPSAANVGGAGGLFQAAVLTASAAPVPINVAVNLAAPKTLGSDVTVKLSVDQAALTAYNTANSTNYILLPAAAYSSTLTAVIKAGTNLTNLVVNVNTGSIDPSITTYVLPITITDGGGQQISNYKTVLYNVQVKNKYDGRYTLTGTLNDVVAPTITGKYPLTVDLKTAGGSSVVYTEGGNLSHSILSGGATSSYGTFAPVFNFDATTNKVISVVNNYGQPAPAATARSGRIDITGINAVTGTPGTVGSVIKIKYVMVQQGADRTFFDETFTYTGPRP